MDAEATELANRVRALLSSEPALEERRMFGAHVFLLDDAGLRFWIDAARRDSVSI